MGKTHIEECSVTVYNVPEYAKKRRYIVATLHRGALWFWGATDDEELALKMLNEDIERRIITERINYNER